jgi:hypothetical protein
MRVFPFCIITQLVLLNAFVFCLFLLFIGVGKCFLLVTPTQLQVPHVRMQQNFPFESLDYRVFFSFRPGLMCVHGLYVCRALGSAPSNGECSLYARCYQN